MPPSLTWLIFATLFVLAAIEMTFAFGMIDSDPLAGVWTFASHLLR